VAIDANGPDFWLVLQPLEDSTPPIIRLRHALKSFLRSYKLRCIDLAQVWPELPAAGAGKPSDGEGS
jgi:hypothetical protein